MTKRRNSGRVTETHAPTVGYKAQFWQMADAPRGSWDGAEYEYNVRPYLSQVHLGRLGGGQHAKLVADEASCADSEDSDEHGAHRIFWVSRETRWQHLRVQACQFTIGQLIDDAMVGVTPDDPALKGVLPKDYARPTLDKGRLGS